jgi:spore maturation protein B
LQVLGEFSNIIIPAIIFYIVGYGVVSKVPVYEHFVKGARDGLDTVVKLVPTLVGLLMAVGVLRSSGFLEFLANLLKGVGDSIGIPEAVLPVILVKLVSNSAATGLVLDIFKTHGPDSYIGTLVSIMMSSTETVFYTMSVYFLAAKVTKTRYTLVGALFATAAGIAASVVLAGM